MNRRHLLSAIVAALVFTGAGCITIGGSSSGSSAGDGGVFKSANKGDTWVQKVAIPTVDGSRKGIGGASVAAMVQDPNDPLAFYIGTVDNGMWFSYDGGDTWRQSAQVSRGRIPSIALDPKNKCIIYVAAENKLVKTEDCSRTWAVRYLDGRTDNVTTAVAVDFYNSDIVWVGMQSGDLFKSVDAGQNWKLVHSFDKSQVLRLAMSPTDSRRIFVALKGGGIWRSDDAGANWKDLSAGYESFSGARDFMDITFGVSDPKLVLFASKYGILRSKDSGDTWEKVDLLTPPGTTLIYSLAVDPRDPNAIYYGTATTFYRSVNGGVNWMPKKLPTSRAATAMLVDRSNSAVLYMGVTKFKD